MYENTVEKLERTVERVKECRELLCGMSKRLEDGGIPKKEYTETTEKVKEMLSTSRDGLVALRWDGGKLPETADERYPTGATTEEAKGKSDPETHLEDAENMLYEAISSHACAESEIAQACESIEQAIYAWDESEEGSWASMRKVHPVDIELTYRKRIGLLSESAEDAEEAARELLEHGLSPSETWSFEGEAFMAARETPLDDDSPIFEA